MVDLAADWAEAGTAVEAAVRRVLASGEFVLGPETAAFESEIAERVGTRFAVGVGSGSEALELALRALGAGPGDEVVTSAFTHFATVEAILRVGARPVFADIEPEGFGIDPSGVEAALTGRTRAVVPVHLFGRCADVARVREVAEAAGIPVVEDAAQAFGAARSGQRAGAFGRLGCFSFYPSKVLGALGDAGMLTTDDPELAARLRLLRSHGTARGDVHVLPGTTSRLDSIQAAALRAKLPFLKGWIEGRARNARIYREELDGCPGVWLPGAGPDEEVVFAQYTLRCAEAPRVRAALAAAGVEWRHYYPRPAAAQPALGALRCEAGTFPEAERCCAEVLSIPVRASVPPAGIREIARVIRDAAAPESSGDRDEDGDGDGL
jgi:dTDP-4-amino-4,6-dideoxygalactose transaminase